MYCVASLTPKKFLDEKGTISKEIFASASCLYVLCFMLKKAVFFYEFSALFLPERYNAGGRPRMGEPYTSPEAFSDTFKDVLFAIVLTNWPLHCSNG